MRLLLLWLAVSAVAAAEVPRLEDCRVIYAHEAETTLFNGPRGALYMDEEIRPAHDQCRRRYAQRQFPFPIQRLRALANLDERFVDANLEALDEHGGQWRLGGTPQDQVRLWRVLQGQPQPLALRSLCISDRCWLPHPRGVARTVLNGPAGITWVLGVERLYRLGQESTTEVALPTPEDPSQASDFLGKHGFGPAWAHQMYRFGDTLWIVRWFTANCMTPGSFVMRVRDNRAELMAWLPRKYVTGLVHQGNQIVALTEKWRERESRFVPAEVIAFPQGHTRGAILQKIAELDGEWATREAASRFLESLPMADAEILRDTLRTTRSPEQRLRLEAALEHMASAATNPPPTEFAGFRSGRLLLVDRQGRQYVQPWQEGTAQPRLVVCDGQQTREIRLPSAGWELDCQGDDDRLYGHDAEAIHALDARTMTWQILARLPRPGGPRLCVVATWRGRLCLGLQLQEAGANPTVKRPFWVDLGAPPREPLLTGTVLARDVLASKDFAYPVVPGQGGLWFLRQQTRPVIGPSGGTNQVCLLQLNDARHGQARPVSEFVELGQHPNVWPVGPDTVIVATDNQCLFYDCGQTTAHRSLSDLVATHEARLEELPGDAWGFTNCGDDDERLSLLRLGSTFYLEEKMGTDLAWSRLRRIGVWVEQRQQQRRPDGFADHMYQPLLNRITAIDATRQRVLTFAEDWKVLQWVSLAGQGAAAEPLVRQPKAWAWHWLNATQLPRLTKAWTMTPAAAQRYVAATPNPLGEPEYQSADLPNFRSWENDQWRETGVSLYGSNTWEDGDGGLWLFRVREAEVLFRDGRRQLIPLEAGTFLSYRLAIESPRAVWVTAEQSLTRFALIGTNWQAQAVFRLPDCGEGFDGPWIVGQDLYYVSGAALHHTSLPVLARLAAPRRLGNWRNAPLAP